MTATPTRGATERSKRSWQRSPIAARAVRLTAYLLPVLAAWLMVRLASRWFIVGTGWRGASLWVGQAVPVSIGSSYVVQRSARRLLPLASLLNLTLVFPDEAPSKFSVALRSGTAKSLRARTANEAAVDALRLVDRLGRHDRLTRGHTERVRAYADLIAAELDLTEDDRLKLAWGVLLHDVGKLEVPGPVLNKREKLTEAEWTLLKAHPAAARGMLAPLAEWLGPWLLAATEHHERWDGNGYPNGLSAQEISLAGRITAVADAYDVITSRRSYKEPMSQAAAREELVRCAGTQFDPAVVRAFLSASIGSQVNAGPLAWLFELRSLSSIASGFSGAASSVAAVGAASVLAVSGAAVVETRVPETLAFVDSAEGQAELDLAGGQQPNVSATLPSSMPTLSSSEALGSSAETTSPADDGAGTSLDVSTTSVADPESTKPSREPTTTSLPPITQATLPQVSTSVPAGTSPPILPGVSRFLLSDGTVSKPALPMGDVVPPVPLANYDTDRDNAPGLLVRRGNGLGESDTRKIQVWNQSGGLLIAGTPTIDLWVATTGFNDDDEGQLVLGLYDCTEKGDGCSSLGQSTISFSQKEFGVDFGLVTISLPTLSRTIGADRILQLRVATTSDSSDDLMFAFGTTSYPARVTID